MTRPAAPRRAPVDLLWLLAAAGAVLTILALVHVIAPLIALLIDMCVCIVVLARAAL